MHRYIIIIFCFTVFFIIAKYSKRYQKLIEVLTILLLIILSGVRYSTGTDYFNYLDYYDKIKNNIEIPNLEKGYLFLNKLFAELNLHYNFVLLFCSALYILLIYKVVKNSVQKEYRWLAIYIFLSNFNLYFFSLSIVRQSVVIGIFVYSIKYIRSREITKYVLLILISSLFHSSAILLIPFYFINRLQEKNLILKIILGILFLTIFFEFIILNKEFIKFGNKIYRNFEYYVIKLKKDNISFLGLTFRTCILLYIYKIRDLFKTEEEKIYFKLYVVAYFIKILMSLGYGIILYRVLPYFEIFEIFFITIFIQNFKGAKIKKNILLLCILCFNIFYFVRVYNTWNNMGEGYKETNASYKIIIEK